MADIFLSYSRADRPTAQIISGALEAEGFSVWWDKVLRAGQTYDEVTENMLRDSSVVVVLWSETSVKSKWVRAEATLGQRGSELVPAMIEEADRPIMFELTQTADLIGWDGDRNDQRWGDFVADIKRSLDKYKAAQAEPEAPEAAAPSGAAQSNDATIETVFWTSIKDGTDPADFEAYLKRYENGHYSDLARNRLAALGAPAVAATQQPAPVAAPAPAPEPVAAKPQPVAEKKKKSGSSLPLLLGALVVLGGGGWYVMTNVIGGDTSTTEKPDEPEPLVIATCSVCPELVALPGGTFEMGSTEDEANHSGNEGPRHTVNLQPFSISKTEITWAEWKACVDAGACREAQGAGNATYPVTGVSWNDASAYAEWLTSQGEIRFRLPSEAQWEYAARAGTTTAYWWGDAANGPGIVRTTVSDTASLPENGFGVSGMLGNVREWVADCYVNSYADAPSDGRVVRTGNCDRRVVRGGSFKTGAAEHRAANRARYGRTIRDSSLGFRVVADTAQP